MQHHSILPDDFITIAHAARIIPSRSGKKLSPATVYRWAKRGKITLYEANGYKVSLTEIQSKFGVKRATIKSSANPKPYTPPFERGK